MLDAMTRRLQEINRVAMVINTSGDSDSVEAALRQTLNYRADATVVLSGTPPASLIHTCVNSGQHVILINRDDHLRAARTSPSTMSRAAREAFHMLHRAGCRKIAVVSSLAGTPSLVARERAFAGCGREAGLDVAVTRAGPTAYRSGFEAGAPAAQRLGPAGCGLLRDRSARPAASWMRPATNSACRCRRISASSASTTSSRRAGRPTTSPHSGSRSTQIADHICALLDETERRLRKAELDSRPSRSGAVRCGRNDGRLDVAVCQIDREVASTAARPA